MIRKDQISWINATWNPSRGCSRVSAGCMKCCAETVAIRFGAPGLSYEGFVDTKYLHWTGKVVFQPRHLLEPLDWWKPRMISVSSMSDLFHEALTDIEIAMVFAVMLKAPQHVYQTMTKRPARMLEFMTTHTPQDCCETVRTFRAIRELGVILTPETWAECGHIWPGISCEDQQSAEERIPLLLDTPAALRWICAEPLLAPIDLRKIEGKRVRVEPRRLDWVVAGAEHGSYARPAQLDWFRSLRDQCAVAGIPFHLKQLCNTNGRRIPFDQWPKDLQIREYPQEATSYVRMLNLQPASAP